MLILKKRDLLIANISRRWVPFAFYAVLAVLCALFNFIADATLGPRINQTLEWRVEHAIRQGIGFALMVAIGTKIVGWWKSKKTFQKAKG